MKEELQQAITAIKDGREDQARMLLAQMLKDDPEYVPGWVLMSKLAPNKLQKAAFLEKILTLEPEHAYARQQMEALEAGVAATPEPEAELDLEEDLDEIEETPVVAPPQVQPYDTEDMVEEEEVQPAWEEFAAEEAAFEPVQAEPVAAEAAPHMPISVEPFDFDAQAAANTLPPWLAEDEELLAAEAGGVVSDETERMPPEPELPAWLKDDDEVAAPAIAPAGGRVRVRETGAAGEPTAPASRPHARTGPPSWLISALIVILTLVFLLLVYFGIRLFT